jgi:co-chaperonin GroES (HSP10)
MMTKENFNQLVEGNVEQPVKGILVLAKPSIKTTTDSGIELDQKTIQEQLNKKEPMYVVAVGAENKFNVGDKVRVSSFMQMNPPLTSTLQGYDLVLCREHDVVTVVKVK